ncbi:HAD family hydrolase [Shimia ponticola]|uniref:HAD family hydrolase n=1 Tax=Shimia ponticola TaxID=2582893 RepID=UPI0011BDDDF8|nr:HAD family hydrolase [Shimia ponticola]
MTQIEAILFDKDGTLFDFDATWTVWAGTTIVGLADGDHGLAQQLANSIEYDLKNQQFLPGSSVIAGTMEEQAAALLPHLPGRTIDNLIAELTERSLDVPQVEVTPLITYFDDLRARRLRLGVATNDAELSMQRHLEIAGVSDFLDFAVGFDSGHGFKPMPGQLLAFAERVGVDPSRCAMVGDSTHDLEAAQAAGMVGIGVLTGPARREDLSGLASVVLPSIAEIPAWLDSLPSDAAAAPLGA